MRQLKRRLRGLIGLLRDPRSGRGRILDSVAWTMGERVITLTLQFVVSVIVANYLGIDEYGRLMYMVAIATLLSTLVASGLNSIVVRDLVKSPDKRYEILGTTFGIRLIAGIIVYAVLALVVLAVGWSGSDRQLMAIVSLTLVFQVTDVVGFWFQAKTQLRYNSIANLSGNGAGSANRVAVVLLGGSIFAVSWSYALEYFVTGLMLCALYWKTGGTLRRWRFEAQRARKYVRQSLPLTLGAGASIINLRVDQVLLGAMLGTAAVGTYAVAARLSEVWYFVPTAISMAVFPAVIRAKEHSDALYRQRMRLLYGIFVWVAVAVAIAVSFLGGPLIRAVYNSEYYGAVPVLLIHVWSAPFLFMNALFNRWLVIEGLLYSSFLRQGAGAALNIALNILLIPRYGPSGSAFATLISYAFTTYGMSFFTRRTWPAAVDMTLGILLPLRATFDLVRRLRPTVQRG